MTAPGWLPVGSGSSTVAALGALIPLVVVLLISAVPIYFRLSERRRRRQGEQRLAEPGAQRDLTAEVEEMRRRQSGG